MRKTSFCEENLNFNYKILTLADNARVTNKFEVRIWQLKIRAYCKYP